MLSPTQTAYNELTTAHRHATEALAALESIKQRGDFRIECACTSDGACAYHAGLTARTFEALRTLGDVMKETRADLAAPTRGR